MARSYFATPAGRVRECLLRLHPPASMRHQHQPSHPTHHTPYTTEITRACSIMACTLGQGNLPGYNLPRGMRSMLPCCTAPQYRTRLHIYIIRRSMRFWMFYPYSRVSVGIAPKTPVTPCFHPVYPVEPAKEKMLPNRKAHQDQTCLGFLLRAVHSSPRL